MGLNEAMEALGWLGYAVAAGFAAYIIYPAIRGRRSRDDQWDDGPRAFKDGYKD